MVMIFFSEVFDLFWSFIVIGIGLLIFYIGIRILTNEPKKTKHQLTPDQIIARINNRKQLRVPFEKFTVYGINGNETAQIDLSEYYPFIVEIGNKHTNENYLTEISYTSKKLKYTFTRILNIDSITAQFKFHGKTTIIYYDQKDLNNHFILFPS